MRLPRKSGHLAIRLSGGWKDVTMGATRRKFTLEFRTEAVHRVSDTGRTVRDVAKELSILENSLGVWVRDERRRMEALEASSAEPLSSAERAELLRLRREAVEKDRVLAFLGKALALLEKLSESADNE